MLLQILFHNKLAPPEQNSWIRPCLEESSSAAKMLEGQVANLLQKYLGNYVRWPSREALKINVRQGNVELTKMQLMPEALNALKLPVKVKDGFLESVKIKVPWSRLGQDPVLVSLDRIFLLAKPATHVEGCNEDAVQEAKRSRVPEMKTRLLEKMQQMISEMIKSWLGSFIDTIIGNLKLSISNIHIRYEYPESNPGHPFAADLKLEKLSITVGKEIFATGGALEPIQKHQESQIAIGNKYVSFEYKSGGDGDRTSSSSDRDSQLGAPEDEDEAQPNLLRRTTIAGLIVGELVEVDSPPRSCNKAMSAVGVVEATCEEVFKLVMSVDARRFEWDSSFEYGSLVEEVDGHTAILYHRLPLDWFPVCVWPRDLCYRRLWRRDGDGSYVVVFYSEEHENCGPQPGFVRAHLEQGGYIISPLKPRNGRPRSQVQHVMQIDLKGWGVGYLSSFQQNCLLQMLNSVAGLREWFSRTDERHVRRRLPVMFNTSSNTCPTTDQMTAANRNSVMLDDSEEDDEFSNS